MHVTLENECNASRTISRPRMWAVSRFCCQNISWTHLAIMNMHRACGVATFVADIITTNSVVHITGTKNLSTVRPVHSPGSGANCTCAVRGCEPRLVTLRWLANDCSIFLSVYDDDCRFWSWDGKFEKNTCGVRERAGVQVCTAELYLNTVFREIQNTACKHEHRPVKIKTIRFL